MVHVDRDAAQPLFEDVEIAIMCRCDVFRAGRARKLNAKPSPTDVFDIVNAVVAKHLASVPFLLPDFKGCVARRASL